MTAEEKKAERWWTLINAGVWWLRASDRDQYAALLPQVKAEGIVVKAFNADVKEAAANGLIVEPHRQPQAGVVAVTR